jgi:hypothetical protein
LLDALSVPLPKQPPAGASVDQGQEVVMTWSRTPLTEQYRLQISNDPRFLKLIRDEHETGNMRSIADLPPGVYYWRIRSSAGALQSPWAETRSFTVK